MQEPPLHWDAAFGRSGGCALHCLVPDNMIKWDPKQREHSPGTHRLAFYVSHGYSRNHRPGLKKASYGLMANGEGIPLLGHVLDGDESGKVWNRRVIKKLVVWFTDHLTDLVYVADSTVVTESNLDPIADKGIRFISRLPATFTQEQEAKDRAWSALS